eukprot:SAG11_NODE_4616_length_1833_cov_1.065744_1_plen_284_part_10
MTETWYFESCVASSVFLLMYVLAHQSRAQPPDLDRAFKLKLVEIFVTVFVSLELWLQVLIHLGHSVFHPKDWIKYFKDPWVILDVCVVVCSWSYLLYANKWASIGRVARVARPLRSLRLVAGIQIVLASTMEDLGLMRDIGIFLMMGLTVFSMIGVTLFRGVIHYECVSDALAESFGSASDARTLYPCPDTLKCAVDYIAAAPVDALLESESRAVCAALPQVREVGEDEYGLTGFDSVPQALVTMIVRMSTDDGLGAVPSALAQGGAQSVNLAWAFAFLSNAVL